MIIGMLGWIGCGKGTAADYFKERGFVNESFAAPLKDATASVFGWPRHLLEGDTEESRKFREASCSFWSKELKREFTPRIALQEVGTEVFRDGFFQDIWVASMRKRLRDHRREGNNVVISDVRFKNEIQMLEEEGGILCWIRHGENPVWYKHAFEANANNSETDRSIMKVDYDFIHQSEWDWVGSPMDHVIFNDSTLENLYEMLHLMYQQELDK